MTDRLSLVRNSGPGPTTEHSARYYTVAEAAHFLAVSPATVWRWIDAGKLQAYRFGPRALRVREDHLHAAIQPARRATAGATPGIPLVIPPPSPEELARRQGLFAKILRNREHRNIAPLTSADLVHLAREDADVIYGDDA
jgi:excisionase family DNA binding protein